MYGLHRRMCGWVVKTGKLPSLRKNTELQFLISHFTLTGVQDFVMELKGRERNSE